MIAMKLRDSFCRIYVLVCYKEQLRWIFVISPNPEVQTPSSSPWWIHTRRTMVLMFHRTSREIDDFGDSGDDVENLS
jgi:hypothetical protein